MDEIDNLKRKLDEFTVNLDAYEVENRRVHEEHKDLEQLILVKENEKNRIEAAIKEVEVHNINAQKHLTELQNVHKDTRRAVHGLAEELVSLEQDKRSSDDETLDRQIKQCKRELHKLENQEKDVQKKVREKEREIDERANDKKKAEEELRNINAELSTLTKRFRLNEMEMRNIKPKQERTKRELEELRRRLEQVLSKR